MIEKEIKYRCPSCNKFLSYKNIVTLSTDCLSCGHHYSTAPMQATLWKHFCFAFKKYYSPRGYATDREF